MIKHYAEDACRTGDIVHSIYR